MLISTEHALRLLTTHDNSSHSSSHLLSVNTSSLPPAISCDQLGQEQVEFSQGFLHIFSSARSSYSHPDLLLIHHHPPTTTHFFRSHWSSTMDFHFLSHYSYIKAIVLYKGNHWTRCAGFMVASWVRLGITDDDLGTSWALPGDNLGMTWG